MLNFYWYVDVCVNCALIFKKLNYKNWFENCTKKVMANTNVRSRCILCMYNCKILKKLNNSKHYFGSYEVLLHIKYIYVSISSSI